MKDKARAGEKLPSVAPWASDDDTALRAAPDSDKPPGGIFGGWQNDMGKTIIAEKAERTATSALRKAIAAEDAEAVRAALQEALDVAAQYGGRPTPSYGQSTEKELAETIVEAQAFVQGDAAAAEARDAPAVSPAGAAESRAHACLPRLPTSCRPSGRLVQAAAACARRAVGRPLRSAPPSRWSARARPWELALRAAHTLANAGCRLEVIDVAPAASTHACERAHCALRVRSRGARPLHPTRGARLPPAARGSRSGSIAGDRTAPSSMSAVCGGVVAARQRVAPH